MFTLQNEMHAKITVGVAYGGVPALVCRYVKVVQVVSCLNARGNTADRLPALWRVGHLATERHLTSCIVGEKRWTPIPTSACVPILPPAPHARPVCNPSGIDTNAIVFIRHLLY